MMRLPFQKKYVDETPLNRCFWLLLPAVVTYLLCIFWLKEFPLWSYIVEGFFVLLFLGATIAVCIKQKNYLQMVKICFTVITSVIKLYLMSEVPKWMAH